MAQKNKIENTLSFKKLTSIIVMMFALMLLVCANFVVFSPDYIKDHSLTNTTKQQPEAPNPTEQKTKSSPDIFNVQEEYLHEKNYFSDLVWFCISKKHGISGTAKLKLIPIDLVSPPPKS